MSFLDSLKKGVYTSSTGGTVPFSFVDLSRKITHRVGSFSFSGVDGTLHQDAGTSGAIYPMALYFYGAMYQAQADLFIKLANDPGPGTLMHPRWGLKRVQLLSATQSENLATEAGQSVINVEFQETLEREFPSLSLASKAAVAALAVIAKVQAVANFVEQVQTAGAQSKLALEKGFLAGANQVNLLSGIVSNNQDLAVEFKTSINNIINNAADMVEAPSLFADSITSAISVIASVPGRISTKLQGMTNVFETIQLHETLEPNLTTKNNVLIDEIIGTSAIVAISESINNNLANVATISRNQAGKANITVPGVEEGFQTREEVLAAVNYIKTQSDNLISFLDSSQLVFENNILSESYIQSVQSYAPAWQVAGTVIKSALDVSFSLPVKRSEILEAPGNILDLCYKFYGTIDDNALDYFILTNNLTGSEIVEIPRGKAVIYYE